MKIRLLVLIVALVVMMCGCSNAPNNSAGYWLNSSGDTPILGNMQGKTQTVLEYLTDTLKSSKIVYLAHSNDKDFGKDTKINGFYILKDGKCRKYVDVPEQYCNEYGRCEITLGVLAKMTDEEITEMLEDSYKDRHEKALKFWKEQISTKTKAYPWVPYYDDITAYLETDKTGNNVIGEGVYLPVAGINDNPHTIHIPGKSDYGISLEVYEDRIDSSSYDGLRKEYFDTGYGTKSDINKINDIYYLKDNFFTAEVYNSKYLCFNAFDSEWTKVKGTLVVREENPSSIHVGLDSMSSSKIDCIDPTENDLLCISQKYYGKYYRQFDSEPIYGYNELPNSQGNVYNIKNQTATSQQIENLPEGSINERFATLYNDNKDFIGWLNIPGTNIDEPVVQTDNNEDYVHKNFQGDYEFSGTLFADYESKITPEGMAANTVLYGHNMRAKYKFYALMNYKHDINFFKFSPLIKFDTLYGDNTYKIFSVFCTNWQEEHGDVFEYTRAINFKTKDEFYDFVLECEDRSIYNTDVDIKYGDEFITLSTCDEETGLSLRLVVVARKVRPNESLYVDTDKITKKTSVKYFKAYYDIFGQQWFGRQWDTSLVQGLDDYIREHDLEDDGTSEGIQQREIEDMSNRTADAAKKQLEKLGFKVTVIRREDDTIAEDYVIGTVPEAHTQAPVGSTVNLIVSLGAKGEPFAVPKLVDMKIDEAVTKCEEYGLKVRIENRESLAEKGMILEQSIAPDTIAYKGDEITLVISTGETPAIS